MKKIQKTNAMRILDKAKIKYDVKTYEYDESDLSGITVSKKVNMNPESVFKTLVLKGDKSGIIVCCIPVTQEINFKNLAKYSNDKKIEMIHLKDLLLTTGYIRGGCSPIGMKKTYKTFIEKSALNNGFIALSAGIRGQQIILNSNDIINFLNAVLFVNE